MSPHETFATPLQLPFHSQLVTSGLFRKLATGLGDHYRAMRNRRVVKGMLELDDRMLRDIGLTRFDVHSALALRLSQDPSKLLSRIASEPHRALNAATRGP